MATEKLFLDLVRDHNEQLTESEKTVVDFIIENKEQVSFMTAESISKSSGVGKSTVIRLSKSLGYKSFTHMRSSLQDEFVKHRLNYRIEKFQEQNDQQSALVRSVHMDIANIKKTLDNMAVDVFEAVVQLIGNVNKIYTLGFRSSVADAYYLGFSLNRMLGNTLPITSTGVLLDQCLKNADKNSLVFVFSFPRYTNQTIKIAKYLKENNMVKIVLITDSIKSPLTKISDYYFLTSTESFIPIYSHISSISIINAIVSSVAQEYSERVNDSLSKDEKYTSDKNIFYI